MAPKKTSSPYTTTRDQRKPVSCTICGVSQALAMESFPVESLPPAADGADLGVEVGDQDGGHGEQHHGGAGGAPSQLTASEGVGVHEGGRHLGRVAWAAAGESDHQLVALDGQVGQDHYRREEHRPELRDDDAAVDARQGGAVDRSGLDQVLIDAAQAGQEHRHHEPRGLPDPGDYHGVDGHSLVDDPVELEVGEAPVLEQLLEPEPWVQHPLPRGPGDDEGECHRIEVDGPERALLPDALVEEDGDEEAQDQAQGDVEDPEHRQVVERYRPARMVPDALVVEPADELVAGDAARPGKGEVQRPEDEAVDEDEGDQHGGRQHQSGELLLQPPPGARPADARCRLGDATGGSAGLLLGHDGCLHGSPPMRADGRAARRVAPPPRQTRYLAASIAFANSLAASADDAPGWLKNFVTTS